MTLKVKIVDYTKENLGEFKIGDYVYCDYYAGYYQIVERKITYNSRFSDDNGVIHFSKNNSWFCKKILNGKGKVSIAVKDIPLKMLRLVTNEEACKIEGILADKKVKGKFEKVGVFPPPSFIREDFNFNEEEFEKFNYKLKRLGVNFNLQDFYDTILEFKQNKTKGQVGNTNVKVFFNTWTLSTDGDYECFDLQIERK